MSHRMRLVASVLAIVLLGTVGCGSDDDGGTQPTVNPNRVTVESVTAAPGEEIAVDIHYHSEGSIIGLEIPLEIGSAACGINEVTFDGGRFEDYVIAIADIDHDARIIDIILADPTDVVREGDWLVATLHLCIAADAPAQPIEISDTSWIENNMRHILSAVTPAQSEVYPEFTGGTITVVLPED